VIRGKEEEIRPVIKGKREDNKASDKEYGTFVLYSASKHILSLVFVHICFVLYTFKTHLFIRVFLRTF
jgi:hypothetical protein